MLLRKTLRSSTLRLALVCVALFGAAILAIFGYVYWSTAEFVRRQSDAAIRGEFTRLVEAYENLGAAGLVHLIDQRVVADNAHQSFYLFAGPSNSYVAGNLKHWPAEMSGASGWASFRTDEWKTEAGDQPLLRAAYRALPGGYRLLVGRDISGYGRFIEKIETALAWGVALIVAFAAFAGVSVSRRTVSRIEAINAMTREIMETNLSRRIPLRGTSDEWDQLAANLNSMLNRIQELIRGIKQVSDGIAHDLRTPLTRIHGRLEAALNCGLSSDGYHALIGATKTEIDAVLRTFSSLLRISRIEADNRAGGFRLVDLSDIAGGVVELFDAAAEERGGRIDFVGSPGALVMGDRDLLFDALSNLVDNAVKYGAAAGDVTVEVTDEGSGPKVAVYDRGPGIPPNQRERVLERFYRLERDRNTPGTGLGLSLVAAVAQLHGAEIKLSDNNPGLSIEIQFPSARARLEHGAPTSSGQKANMLLSPLNIEPATETPVIQLDDG